MRKIIFRGKTIKKSWVYGELVTVDPHHYDHLENPSKIIVGEVKAIGCGNCIQESAANCEVYSATVGQYVGINDKNGCYIYEGDIIRAVLPETVACREYAWPLMAVAFHEGAFGVWQNARDFTPLRSFASRVEFTIVGNIHDNPDMIGGA